MKQTWIQAALSLCICVVWSSCTPLPRVNNVSRTAQLNDRSTISATRTVEPLIAQRLERAMEQAGTKPWTADRNSATRSQKPEKNSTPSIQKLRTKTGTFRNVEVSDRGETLRVTGPSGDFCAAVSIAPQLAVTALHCVRTLCEPAFAPVGTSLLGCQIAFELPSGPLGDATVVSTSENDLLALLDLHRPLPKSGALFCDNPHAKDRVYTVSHPAGHNWMVSYGWLTRDPILLEWVEGEATRVLVAEIPTKPGSSGGGLFDDQDRVVGVQIARWSPWTTDFGKAAFIQSSRVFNMAGSYCMKHGSSACVGLRCTSSNYDIWEFDRKNVKNRSAQLPYTRAPFLSM